MPEEILLRICYRYDSNSSPRVLLARLISSDILRQFCKELLLDFYEGRFKLIMKASSMPADDVMR